MVDKQQELVNDVKEITKAMVCITNFLGQFPDKYIEGQVITDYVHRKCRIKYYINIVRALEMMVNSYMVNQERKGVMVGDNKFKIWY